MQPPVDDRATLFAAGAAALRFNAPLGDDRAGELINTLRRVGARSVVDLGCGRGELARLIAIEWEGATVVGVDVDGKATAGIRRLGLDGRGPPVDRLGRSAFDQERVGRIRGWLGRRCAFGGDAGRPRVRR